MELCIKAVRTTLEYGDRAKAEVLRDGHIVRLAEPKGFASWTKRHWRKALHPVESWRDSKGRTARLEAVRVEVLIFTLQEADPRPGGSAFLPMSNGMGLDITIQQPGGNPWVSRTPEHMWEAFEGLPIFGAQWECAVLKPHDIVRHGPEKAFRHMDADHWVSDDPVPAWLAHEALNGAKLASSLAEAFPKLEETDEGFFLSSPAAWRLAVAADSLTPLLRSTSGLNPARHPQKQFPSSSSQLKQMGEAKKIKNSWWLDWLARVDGAPLVEEMLLAPKLMRGWHKPVFSRFPLEEFEMFVDAWEFLTREDTLPRPAQLGDMLMMSARGGTDKERAYNVFLVGPARAASPLWQPSSRPAQKISETVYAYPVAGYMPLFEEGAR